MISKWPKLCLLFKITCLLSCHDLVFSALVHQLFEFTFLALKCANEAFCWRSPADAPIIHRCKYVEFLSLLSFSLSHYHTGGSTYVWHLRAAPFILPYNYILSVFANLDFDSGQLYVFSWANATFRFVCLLSFWFSWRNIERLWFAHHPWIHKSDAKFSRENISLTIRYTKKKCKRWYKKFSQSRQL